MENLNPITGFSNLSEEVAREPDRCNNCGDFATHLEHIPTIRLEPYRLCAKCWRNVRVNQLRNCGEKNAYKLIYGTEEENNDVC